MATEQERHARKRLIDETRAAVEKLIREYRKAAKVGGRTAAEQEREWKLAKLAQGVKRERDLALREAEKFKNYSRQADQEIAQLRLELARLTTPRPIAEAPRDGRSVLVCWGVGRKGCLWTPEVMHWDDDRAKWMRGGESVPWAQQPSYYLPLPEVKS